MTSFLHQVAQDLYTRYGERLSDLHLVFPSRRAQLFFADSLTTVLKQPLWEPHYTGLDDLVQMYTPLKLADDFNLMITLYQVYCRHTKSQESFDQFYFWGETLLTDFDEIDRYLVDARLLFLNLQNQKDLEGDFSFLNDEQIAYLQSFWASFNPNPSGNLQGQFIEVWTVLHAIYLDFRAQLLARGETYMGMIYRDMADQLATAPAPNLTGKYIFVGFNALGACEKRLFQFMKDHDKADFYWDYDRYYVDNTAQEAGLFLRDNIKMFPAPSSFELQSSFISPKNIQIIATPTAVLQAKLVPQLLENFGIKETDTHSTSGDLRNTAIVLADENLLIPTLHALPNWLSEINVSLAYPFSQTPVFTLVELLIALQLSYHPKRGFYYKEVQALLQHQYISSLANTNELLSTIRQHNWIYIHESKLTDNALFQLIFTPHNQGVGLIHYLQAFFTYLAAHASQDIDEEQAEAQTTESTDHLQDQELRNEYIFVLNRALNRFENAIINEQFELGMSVFLSLLRNMLRQLKIPFVGEPVRGLQVMGMMETRNIDFDQIIVLSANEKTLPVGQSSSSFIPYHLRKAFGMPNQEMKEAVSAYHFYRLLQRSKEVVLVYSTKNSEDRSGEMSRYLYQLKFESNHTISEQSLLYPIHFNEKKTISVQKTPDVLDRLRVFLGRQATVSLSPSALSTYIACPLQFYFSKVAKLREPELMQEELATNVLGNILHQVMEELYKPYLGKTMTRADLKPIIDNKKERFELIDKVFAETYFKQSALPADFKQNGKLLIARDVIRKYVRGILEVDQKNPGFTLIGFEKRVATPLPFQLNNKEYMVLIGGIIDRIDLYQDTVRIIDYKTGGGRGLEKRLHFDGVASLFDTHPDKRNKEAFQTFLYALVYSKSSPKDVIVPALYFVRDAMSPQFSYLLKDKKGDTVVDFVPYTAEFSELLSECLSELFNKEIPFQQTEHAKVCTLCLYKEICGRTK